MYIIKVTKFGNPPKKVKINIDVIIKNYFKVNHSKKRTKNARAEIERLNKEREELHEQVITLPKFPNINFRHKNQQHDRYQSKKFYSRQ